MNLCIDIGNTSEKLAIFEGKNEIYFARKQHLDLDYLDSLMAEFPNIKNGLISSTKKKNEVLIHHLSSKINLIPWEADTELPIDLAYTTIETLGKDRIASVVAAAFYYPAENCVVVNAGTCITMDFINQNSLYEGGNISPGLEMRLKAMHTFTANLPLVELDYKGNLLGASTNEALQNGAILGAIGEFESFIERIYHEKGNTNIILTGGDAIFFVELSKYKIFAHSNLVLTGLNEILHFNAQ